MNYAKTLYPLMVLALISACHRSDNSRSAYNNPKSYKDYEFDMLKDPETGQIPYNIRQLELEFAKTLPKHQNLSKTTDLWESIGPYNIGGRTRSFALDISNPNILLAGGVSGGIFRSEDDGGSWDKITPPDQIHSVTCLKQDRRPGKTNIWYYGTGEGYGGSASGEGAYYLGDGIYKSTDGGQSFQVLSATQSNSPQSFSSPFEIIWNLATSPVDSIDKLYAATYGNVYQSLNGGTSWQSLKGGDSYFTDVACTSQDIVYFTMSSDGSQKGIWRKESSGLPVNITPSNFATTYNRLIIAIDPNNENVVYFLGNTPGSGKFTQVFFGETEYNSLWKYEYVSGNGSGAGGVWTDLSQNIPEDGFEFDNFNAQGSYNLVMSVMPGNSNVLFIGGTNLYRSTDAFATANNTTQVGGYAIHTTLPFFRVYPGHHPDQHLVFFHPSDSTMMYSATDGGIYKTNDCLADSITWLSLNHGYLSTQFHAIGLDRGTIGSKVVAGGFQDYGSWFQNSADPETAWKYTSSGDGAFLAFHDGGDLAYFSRQNGEIIKTELDNTGNVLGYTRIDPIGASNYLFINPFILDPTDQNIMYMAEGNKLWRNSDLSDIAIDNQYQKISTNWFRFTDTLPSTYKISALAVSSENPYYRLYIGTSSKKLYKIDNASFSDPVFTEITGPWSSNTYVSSIAVDPNDGDHVVVCLSNYSTYSLYHSRDGGTTWKKCAGNLEQYPNGVGYGPSTRWVNIMSVNGQNTYWVGTSVGLFATGELMDDSTIWVQQSPNKIGNVVVPMMDVRSLDGTVVVGTHGNGAYRGTITDLIDLTGIAQVSENKLSFSVYPNPCKGDEVTLQIPEKIQWIEIYNQEQKCLMSMPWRDQKNLRLPKVSGVLYIRARDVQGRIYVSKLIKF